MQLTLQAKEIRRLHEIVRWIIRKPKYLSVHFITFRNRPALAIHHYDFTTVLPIRGRRLSTSLKIPYKQLQEVPNCAEGKVTVRIHPKKGIGQVHWFDSDGKDFSPPFPIRLDNFTTVGAPSETDDLKEYPTTLLDDIWRSAKSCLNTRYPNLSCVHVMPDGELRSTDASFALGIQTPYRFDCAENTLIRSCELFGKRNLRRSKTFRMGFGGRTVHFDFGDFHFFSKPNVEHYPDLTKVFSKDETIQTRLTLDPADAAFLKKHLAKLPGRDEHDAPVTLVCDYDHSVSVHGSQAERAKTKAILLARSSYEGDAYVVQTNRKHLLQALSLGCLDFCFGTSYPMALTENRRFCWSPLDDSALPLESEHPLPPVVVLRSDQPFTEKEKP